MPTPDRLPAALAALDDAGLRRTRRTVTARHGAVVEVAGRQLLNFATNDYLGLAEHPELAAAAIEGARRWGVGAGASHLVCGHFAPHHRAERLLADYVGCEAALLCSTGYLANAGVLAALVGRSGAVFADRLNHASLIDGALLSRATHHRYPHGDVATLARQLAGSTAEEKLIVTDSVFSMDGDLAPLAALLELAEAHNAWLLIDDAHGLGVIGPQGRGALAHARLSSPRIVYMGTLGKAAGVGGAFVAGSAPLIDWLLQKMRTYIYTTAMPPMQAEALCAAVPLMAAADERRARLGRHIARLQSALGAHLLPSTTAIQPLRVGGNHAAVAAAQALFDAGVWVPAIRPPTVPDGSARLRISLSAAHEDTMIDTLLGALAACLPAT